LASVAGVLDTRRTERIGGQDFIAYTQPVLATERLDEVRIAIESRDDELAAAALSEVLSKANPAEPDRTRWYYLLGIIEERRGDDVRAKIAFREASSEPGPLRLDALLHLRSLAVTTRECSALRQIRDEVQEIEGSSEESTLIAGEIAYCEGRSKDAQKTYETVIAGVNNPRQRALYQVRLAEIITNDLGKCEARNSEVVDEIARLVKQARDGASGYEPVMERTSRIITDITCPERATVPVGFRVESLEFADDLLDRRRWAEAKQLLAAWEGETGAEPEFASTLCRVQFAQGRLAAGLENGREAQERYDWVAAHCEDADLVARALFLGAGQCAKRGNSAEAITRYAELERRFAAHRLADDARLKTAMLYRKLGSEKQFVELLDGMPDLYPAADMTQEGLFVLALESMLRRDWGAAASVLERAEKVGKASGAMREQERDRIMYFLARTKLSLGKVDEAKVALQNLVTNRPLTYYMLLAYSLLLAQGAESTTVGIEQGLAIAESQQADPRLVAATRDARLGRVIALLAVGDLGAASERVLGLSSPSDVSESFWTMVGLYVEAGAVQTALAMIKSRTDDFRVRWPTGSWVPFWKMAYPIPYEAIVKLESTKTKVPESLIYAIMREESEFEPTAVSGANAYGLMQLIVPTAVHAARGTAYVATRKTLLKPSTNIALGARVLGTLLERFRGQAVLAIAGYNAGPGRPSRWLKEKPEAPLDLWVEAIEYAETRNYVKRVLSSRAAYRWLYGSPGERSTVEPIEFTLFGP
jgi:soluble lytic murein transglycosylase